MTVTVVTVDRTALPTALLPIAKSHLRVDGTYDDAYIENALARAIGRIEDANGITINPTTATWTPGTGDFCGDGATLPARPASGFTATAGSPPADVKSSYDIVLKWDDITGIPIQTLQGAATSGLTVTLELGYTTATLPPQVLDRILRHAAHLYDHREILTPDAPYVAPDMGLDGTWWMPRL
jgi:hypothetical protein